MKCVRCSSCGKVLGNKWECIDKLLKDGKKLPEIYEMLLIRRYCCKKVIMTSIDCSPFNEYPDKECQDRNSYTLHHENEINTFMQSK